MDELFRKIAKHSSDIIGSAGTFVIAFVIVIIWALTGPIFHFSDTWQLIINTATTISTGLIVFLVQNTQNRDGRAIQIKLDELLRAQKGARTGLIDIEELSDKDLDALQLDFQKIHQQYSHQLLHALHARVEAESARRQSAKIH